jgi:hypothetical protein
MKFEGELTDKIRELEAEVGRLRALCVEAYAALAVRGNSNDLTDRLRRAALAKEENDG